MTKMKFIIGFATVLLLGMGSMSVSAKATDAGAMHKYAAAADIVFDKDKGGNDDDDDRKKKGR